MMRTTLSGMDLNDYRLLRFKQLLKDRFAENQSALAAKIDRQASYVSRILSGKKKLGEQLAQDIEDKLELGRGWFIQGAVEEFDAETLRFAAWFASLDERGRQGFASFIGSVPPATLPKLRSSPRPSAVDFGKIESQTDARYSVSTEPKAPGRKNKPPTAA